jgi:hypothetical protein
MTTSIKRKEVRAILVDWIAGNLSARQVYEWAEARYAT